MEYNGKHYYKVDVMGRNGYSFMVVSKDELDEYDVLNKSYLKGLIFKSILKPLVMIIWNYYRKGLIRWMMR